ncbi:hypothetical protein PV10_01540 [Exophiala mesophila]|uniref:Uncharacterized protein n=1 Tax=Exophiala mesophila TaxID=212818 RepID=A0A0D1X7J9_EXOME|nr:uncharacterized protein PV10_01540 [Exophiala mesophila]KIV97835.1 hypothetical protein PV10_01540 [Exophiala mesophila]
MSDNREHHNNQTRASAGMGYVLRSLLLPAAVPSDNSPSQPQQPFVDSTGFLRCPLPVLPPEETDFPVLSTTSKRDGHGRIISEKANTSSNVFHRQEPPPPCSESLVVENVSDTSDQESETNPTKKRKFSNQAMVDKYRRDMAIIRQEMATDEDADMTEQTEAVKETPMAESDTESEPHRELPRS